MIRAFLFATATHAFVVPSLRCLSAIHLASAIRLPARTKDNRARPVNQQRSEIGIASFGDSQKALLVATGMLPRNQAQLGG